MDFTRPNTSFEYQQGPGMSVGWNRFGSTFSRGTIGTPRTVPSLSFQGGING